MTIVLLTTSTCRKCEMIKTPLKKFCEENEISLSILDATEEGAGREIALAHNIMRVPALFLYDDNGNLVETFIGDIYLEDVKKLI